MEPIGNNGISKGMNQVLEEGVVLKVEKRDPGILLELAGILSIPLLGLMVVIREPSPFSFMLLLIALLISYEIVMALRRKNIKVDREGVEINERLEMIPGGAVYINADEPARIKWGEVERIKVYQPTRDITKPSAADTLSNMSIISGILDDDFDSFFHLITKEGGMYRGGLRDKESVKDFRSKLKKIGFKRLIINK